MVYLVSVAIYVVLSLLSAISSSIAMLVAMRVLAGGAGCATTPTGAAVVADVWNVEERGQAMSVYYLGVLFGPTFGPVLGGLLTQRWSWRATQWFQTIYGLATFVPLFCFLPNTRPGVARRQTPASMSEKPGRRGTLLSRLREAAGGACSAVLLPLRVVFFLRSPAISWSIYLTSITFMAGKMIQISIEASFAGPPYHFSASIIGLTFLPLSIGLIVGDITGGKWSDYVMRKATIVSRQDNESILDPHVPENRFQWNAWFAVLIFPIGFIWYGWSIENGELWIIPVRTSIRTPSSMADQLRIIDAW